MVGINSFPSGAQTAHSHVGEYCSFLMGTTSIMLPSTLNRGLKTNLQKIGTAVCSLFLSYGIETILQYFTIMVGLLRKCLAALLT